MRLAIIEDDELSRELLTLILCADQAVSAVEAYVSAEEALERLEEFSPQVMLVDLELPAMPGVELIRRVRSARPEVKIVVVTIFEDRGAVIEAIKAGATGYLLKGIPARELMAGLRTISSGGASISPRIARMLLLQLQEAPEQADALTELEENLLKELARGITDQQLAESVGLTAEELQPRVTAIYRKFHTPL
jgi:two-component system response regulator DegU